jgi:hypothetical protein
MNSEIENYEYPTQRIANVWNYTFAVTVVVIGLASLYFIFGHHSTKDLMDLITR